MSGLCVASALSVGAAGLRELTAGGTRPGGDAGAPSATTRAGEEADPTKSVEARLAEARARLAAFGDISSTNGAGGVSLQELWTRRALLHRLVLLYEQQLSNAEALPKAKARNAAAVRQAQEWTRFSDPPPYSILFTDRLREELQAEKQKIQNAEASGPLFNQLVEENRSILTQAEEKIRQLNEQLETAKDPARTLSGQRELQRLHSQVGAATIGVLESERLLEQEALAESRARYGLLQRQLMMASIEATFTEADLEQVNARIERQGNQLEQELADAQTRRGGAVQALDSARDESRQAVTPRSTELVSTREAQLDAADTAVGLLRLMLEGTSVERTMWELRFATYRSRSAEQITDSEHRLRAFNRRLNLWLQPVRQQLEVSSSQVQLQSARVNDLPADAELRPLVQARLDALRQRDQLLLRTVRAMENMQRLGRRWAEELIAAEEKLPLSGRVHNLFSDARSFLQKLWNFEVFTAEDTITVDGQKVSGKRSVTIGKVVMAVLIVVVGFWVTGFLSRLTQPILVRRLKIEPNEANLIRRWLRALLLVCLLMFSLVSVKIPLTVFAFAGGALAIGLGFGMQTLLKNFVSGLILLFERPFRVGDVLDVGGQKGTVTSIGLRASVLQLWDGTETLIPNSTLLESNVTNWTYTNRNVRFSVSVGVAYGSDPRQVMKLLGEAADRHGLVEKDPLPQVLFTQFGDSTLNFELRFWVDVSRSNAAQVSSDLRMMIASSFAEAGIVIAFPQRDVRLNAAGPLRVEVVTGVGAQPDAEGPGKPTGQ